MRKDWEGLHRIRMVWIEKDWTGKDQIGSERIGWMYGFGFGMIGFGLGLVRVW